MLRAGNEQLEDYAGFKKMNQKNDLIDLKY